MPRLHNPAAIWKVARAGNLRGRLRANRDGVTAIRLHVAGAAVETGVLDALAAGSASTAGLAGRVGARHESLLAAFLRVLVEAGFVRGDGEDGPWRLTDRGRAVVDDDLVRATYQAFSGFHTALYRVMPPLLDGGPPRRDVAEQGALIARISAAFEPMLLGALTRAVRERAPRRVLDVGCGTGLELATMLGAAPGAEGVGIDIDPGAVALAERNLIGRGVADRARILCADVREPPSGPLAEPFEFALLANVLYYLPMTERVAFLRHIAGLLHPGGVLFVVTTVATPQFFSRHFDLLLRAQDGAMQLSTAEQLAGQLAEAGFRPGPPRSLVPGAPVVTMSATSAG